MKKIIAILSFIALVALGGCTTKNAEVAEPQSTTNVTFSAFNDETYVWESFHFTTNRVQGVR